MKYYLLFFLLFNYAIQSKPLSQCTSAVATFYDNSGNGACGFGLPKMYGAAIDDKMYKNAEKCGICYELVGPKGAVKIMVDDLDPNDERATESFAHFDCHKNTFPQIADEEWGELTITWRMVSCGHQGNINLVTHEDSHENYYSFYVTNHEIGLKHVYYSSDNEQWTSLERTDYNRWTVPGTIQFPAYFQFESIAGEKVSTTITELKAGYSHDTGVQFQVPDKYFDARNLVEVPKIDEECCKLFDAYSQIFYDGKFYKEWSDGSNAQKEDITSNCVEEGKKCMKVNFVDWKVFKFMNRFKAEARRYNGIEFYVKSETACNNCLKIKFNEFDWHSISISDVNKWEKITLNLNDLGSESDIESFMFQGTSAESTIIYFDQIKLVKSDFIDNGNCADPDEGGSGGADKRDPDEDGSNSARNIVNTSLLFISNIIMFVLLFI